MVHRRVIGLEESAVGWGFGIEKTQQSGSETCTIVIV